MKCQIYQKGTSGQSLVHKDTRFDLLYAKRGQLVFHNRISHFIKTFQALIDPYTLDLSQKILELLQSSKLIKYFYCKTPSILDNAKKNIKNHFAKGLIMIESLIFGIILKIKFKALSLVINNSKLIVHAPEDIYSKYYGFYNQNLEIKSMLTKLNS